MLHCKIKTEKTGEVANNCFLLHFCFSTWCVPEKKKIIYVVKWFFCRCWGSKPPWCSIARSGWEEWQWEVSALMCLEHWKLQAVTTKLQMDLRQFSSLVMSLLLKTVSYPECLAILNSIITQCTPTEICCVLLLLFDISDCIVFEQWHSCKVCSDRAETALPLTVPVS